MPFLKTPIDGLLVFEPQVWSDDRGYFFESYNTIVFEQAGIVRPFVQDNQARSSYGTVRGLHYQCGAYAQAKLVRVTLGEVLDVVVDLRTDSLTYGQSYSVRLSDENHRQLYVPRGFAHGYAVLSKEAVFQYKCDNFYAKAHEGGLAWDDPQLGIDWLIDPGIVILSEKDTLNPEFGAHKPAL
jgi:dTDP-4-dehydrorhamnose 3,5-epimerase